MSHDWSRDRERVDLAALVASYLGPAPGRAGERGRLLWWPCPIHADKNPSFVVDPGKLFWKCYGCGESGDAAALVMKIDGKSFPEAVAALLGESPAPRREWTRPTPPPKPTTPEPSLGLTEGEALILIERAERRLWTPEGGPALAYLTAERRLLPETIRVHRLGWTPGERLTTKDGRGYTARGVVLPWFERGRPVLVKIRQPEGSKPKYAEAYRARPRVFPDPRAVRPGRGLILTEGEFDALVLGQALPELAVATLGSASARPDPLTLIALMPSSPWWIATDADEAGDKAAGGWPAQARRVRPPEGFKDWTEAAQAGVDLGRWWRNRIEGNESPALYGPLDLDAMRRGGADAEPSIVIAGGWPWRVANWPTDRWLAWHRRNGEIAPPGSTAAAVLAAQHQAYVELCEGEPEHDHHGARLLAAHRDSTD